MRGRPLIERGGIFYLVRKVRPTKFLGWAVFGRLQNEYIRLSPFFKTRAKAEPFLVPGAEIRRKFKSKVRKAYDLAPVQRG